MSNVTCDVQFQRCLLRQKRYNTRTSVETIHSAIVNSSNLGKLYKLNIYNQTWLIILLRTVKIKKYVLFHGMQPSIVHVMLHFTTCVRR